MVSSSPYPPAGRPSCSCGSPCPPAPWCRGSDSSRTCGPMKRCRRGTTRSSRWCPGFVGLSVTRPSSSVGRSATRWRSIPVRSTRWTSSAERTRSRRCGRREAPPLPWTRAPRPWRCSVPRASSTPTTPNGCRPFRSQAEELRLRLIEDSLGARVDLGATGEVVAELQELVAAHPLREGLWALLITALYRDGRQADALAAYRSVREHLVEELGLEPGRELQRLEQQVLEHDRALDAPAAPTPPPSHAPAEGGNLPPLSSTLVGRATECAEVADLVATRRLVTLVGPAGVGKTRLALEVARQVDAADGAWLVRLESARTDAAVGDVVADSLNASGSSEAALVERLRGADILIVLDNCEHVVDSAARSGRNPPARRIGRSRAGHQPGPHRNRRGAGLRGRSPGVHRRRDPLRRAGRRPRPGRPRVR